MNSSDRTGKLINWVNASVAQITVSPQVSFPSRRVSDPDVIPRLDRGIHGSRSGIEVVDPAVKPRDDVRYNLPCDMARTHPQLVKSLKPLAGDASFRKYYRFSLGERNFIAVDSPPDQEENHAFVSVAQALAKIGIQVPKIFAYEPQQGFFILSDFGDTLLADILNESNAEHLYQQALTELLPIQTCHDFAKWQLPEYSQELLLQECNLFSDWFLDQYCQIKLSAKAQQALTNCYQHLIIAASEQPKVCTHRDYHSRNLMVLDSGRLGVIDFQSAVYGPITYDVVSLLRDCYIAWPPAMVRSLANNYLEQAIAHDIYPEHLAMEWPRWFDWMGLQRHLKAVGIFARLAKRDGKMRYLDDIPRALNYIVQVSRDYEELRWLGSFIEGSVLPRLREHAL